MRARSTIATVAALAIGTASLFAWQMLREKKSQPRIAFSVVGYATTNLAVRMEQAGELCDLSGTTPYFRFAARGGGDVRAGKPLLAALVRVANSGRSSIEIEREFMCVVGSAARSDTWFKEWLCSGDMTKVRAGEAADFCVLLPRETADWQVGLTCCYEPSWWQRMRDRLESHWPSFPQRLLPKAAEQIPEEVWSHRFSVRTTTSERGAEKTHNPVAAPNDGPATRCGNAGTTEGPPSVS